MNKILFSGFFFLTAYLGFAQGNTPFLEKGISFIHKNQDSAYFYLQKSLQKSKEDNNLGQKLRTYLYLMDANGFYFDMVNFKTNLDKMAELVRCDPRFDGFVYENYYRNYLLFNQALYNFRISNYQESKNEFLKLYRKLERIPKEELELSNIWFLNSILNFVAKIYYDTGKISLAKLYYTKKIDFNNAFPEVFGNKGIAYSNLSLASLLQKEKNYKEAEKHIQKAISLYKFHWNDPLYKNNLVSSHQFLAKNYLLQKKPKMALSVLHELKRYNLFDLENNRFSKEYFTYNARAFSQLEQSEKAIRFYEKALQTTERYYQTKHHPEIAGIYSEMAQVFADAHEYEKSLSFFQKAFSALSKQFKNEDFLQNPEPKKVSSNLKLLEILGEKQNVLAKAYKFKADSKYLLAANKTAKDFIRTLDALKPEFESKADIQLLLEEISPAFDKMIENTFLLYKKTGKEKFLEDAFLFSEKSKAALLLSAVQRSGATKFAGVPESILAKEKEYQAKINHFEKKHFENPGDDQLQDELFKLKNNFVLFLTEIKNNYPKYYRLKFNTNVVNTQEIRTLLKPNEAFLEYYMSKDKLYCFVLQKEKKELFKIPFPGTSKNRVRRLHELISTPSVLKIKEIKNIGDSLRTKLIPEMDEQISKLTIVRSGILNYLPFGALYNKEKKQYLIRNFSITIANSATLYREFTNQNEVKDPQILAFAPSFSNEKIPAMRTGLGKLVFNKMEVENISAYFEGKILLNEQATIKAFKNQANNFEIIHFATHAAVNDTNPDYSYLAFASKDSVANLLYINDLYNFDLKAKMVVLSACETGIGKLHKSAGMLSLARGFNYAGASSLVTTQWKIEDKSAAFLMKDFYKNLAEGQPKNEALQKAKLHYLENTQDAMRRHPYYWAGFVVSGDVSPIVAQTHGYTYLYIAGFLFLTGIFIFWKRKKIIFKNQKPNFRIF